MTPDDMEGRLLARLSVLYADARNGTPVTDPNEHDADELAEIISDLRALLLDYQERGRALEAASPVVPAPEGEAVGDPVLWKDRPDEWTDAILAAHPVNSTDPERHNRFALAMKMVGNRHGKYELVGLVHWLLTRLEAASPVVPVGRGDVEVVAEWLEMAKETPKQLHSSLNYVPVCPSEIEAIERILAALGTKGADTGREG